MKYAFMSFSCPEATWEEMLSLAERFGYDGVEPRIGQGHGHGVELETDAARRREARERAAERGMAICCLATSCSFADPSTTAENRDLTLRCIDLAAEVGAPCIRVFGGRIPRGVSRERARDLLVESLVSVADHAQSAGVTVCMETHDDWCDPEQVAQVMRAVDRPRVGVNWDIMHPVRVAGASMDEAFRTLRPWIRHVHFHDGRTVEGRLVWCPIGEGEVDHRRALQLLAGDLYDGYLSGEWIGWEPCEAHLPRELATMKRYEAQMS